MIFTQAIQRNAQVYKNQIALKCADRTHTWGELEDRIARLAAGLQVNGVKPGDRVAILALNSDRYLEFYYATAWVGAVMVPLNTRWSIKENEYALNDSGSVMLMVDDTFLKSGNELKQACGLVNNFVYLGDNNTPEGMLNYEEVIASNLPISAFESSTTDMLGIFYTGGTTGFPKGVMLSHKNIWVSSIAIMTEMNFNNRDLGSMMMVAGPMFHLAAGAMCWSSVIGGVPITVVPAFNVDDVLTCIERDKVTDCLLVPTMISMLLADKALATADLSTLKQIIYGASPMPEGTLLEAMEKIPTVGFIQAYGQTELAPACSLLPAKYHTLEGPLSGKIRSAGRPVFTLNVSIRDEHNNELATNQIGEICAKGENVMMGYWNNPEQTSAALANGWLHTGDAGYIDEDGFIFLVDRVKDMIVSGGENVFSAEVESALSKHPDVHEVAVIGIPCQQWGEAVHAIVRLKPDTSNEEQNIITFCREYIAGYKVPRSIEFRNEPFPITGAGKIQKNELREVYWKDQERNIN
ncbi:long-chain fatty acid--CoA ligase [Colwelliaceae bacterium BS250]